MPSPNSNLSNVLICEDQYVSAVGVEFVLRKHSPVPLKVRTARTGAEALEMVQKESPQIAVIDLSLPDISGIEVIKVIRQNYPSTHVLVLTAQDKPHVIRQVCQMKVAAVLRKIDTDENLKNALQFLTGRKGKTYLDPSVQNILRSTANTSLSRREYEVVELMAKGLTSGEIAARMDCSITTIKTYRSRIMNKSASRNSAEIMAWYLKGNAKRGDGSTGGGGL